VSTALAAAATHPALSHSFYVIALVVALPLAALLCRRVGDLIPCLVGGAIWGAVVWWGPLVPHSPLACTRAGASCGASEGTISLFELVLGPALIVLYKMIRGDKRGSNGSRLP
jgi:hypothetical protein